MRRLTCLLLASLALPACILDEDDPDAQAIPGLDEPPCPMSFATFRITRIVLPSNATESVGLGLDLDHKANDGVDNVLGSLLALMTSVSESWRVQPALDGHLAAGELDWLLEVGRCADGSDDQVRVHLSRGVDVDGDGVLEVGARGVAAVGRGASISTERGIAEVPVGMLTDGEGTLATDAWIPGLSLTTALETRDGAIDGRIGFGVGDLGEGGLAPIAAYATRTLDETGGIGDFWRGYDRNRNGVIDTAEAGLLVDELATRDLDLGDCDDVSCYRPGGDDGLNDHYSFGFVIHAEPITVE